ncbi:MAG: aldehyde ferredoxin oxidoreductase N-terminal domain-containing protein [Candidatus Bathyarchaeia archaeon]
MYKGYAGKLLYIDFENNSIKPKEIPEELILNYLGGAGFCSKILFEMIKAGTDSLGPENVIAFMTGPLTGTLFPQASRYVVATKSPLTGIWGEAHAAGHWGPELKFAGFDGIIIEGVAKKPVYLFIEDKNVEIKDASFLWGKTCYEVDDILKKEYRDDDLRIASIGPAGENLARFAAILNDRDRCAARAGMGAVMGSKRLKAIAIRGSKDLEIADLKAYEKLMDELEKKMLTHPFTENRAKYGTTNLIELMQEIGRLPSYNMREGVFDEYEKIGGEIIRQKYLIKPRADFACIQRCGRYTCVNEGPYAYPPAGSPEFESQSALGSRCGISNIEAVLYAHYLCNAYGLDTISTGATISWAMECYEKGIITKEDTDGLELKWGKLQR